MKCIMGTGILGSEDMLQYASYSQIKRELIPYETIKYILTV